MHDLVSKQRSSISVNELEGILLRGKRSRDEIGGVASAPSSPKGSKRASQDIIKINRSKLYDPRELRKNLSNTFKLMPRSRIGSDRPNFLPFIRPAINTSDATLSIKKGAANKIQKASDSYSLVLEENELYNGSCSNANRGTQHKKNSRSPLDRRHLGQMETLLEYIDTEDEENNTNKFRKRTLAKAGDSNNSTQLSVFDTSEKLRAESGLYLAHKSKAPKLLGKHSKNSYFNHSASMVVAVLPKQRAKSLFQKLKKRVESICQPTVLEASQCQQAVNSDAQKSTENLEQIKSVYEIYDFEEAATDDFSKSQDANGTFIQLIDRSACGEDGTKIAGPAETYVQLQQESNAEAVKDYDTSYYATVARFEYLNEILVRLSRWWSHTAQEFRYEEPRADRFIVEYHSPHSYSKQRQSFAKPFRGEDDLLQTTPSSKSNMSIERIVSRRLCLIPPCLRRNEYKSRPTVDSKAEVKELLSECKLFLPKFFEQLSDSIPQTNDRKRI